MIGMMSWLLVCGFATTVATSSTTTASATTATVSKTAASKKASTTTTSPSTDDKIEELTEASLARLTGDDGGLINSLLVYFQSAYEDHPEISEVPTLLRSRNLDTKVVQVTKKNRVLEAKFGVDTRPALVLWRRYGNGILQDDRSSPPRTTPATLLHYHGLDTAAEIVRWTRRKVEGPLTANTPSNIETWLKAERCLVVGFFIKDATAVGEAAVFAAAARGDDDFVYVLVQTNELMAYYHQSSGAIIVMKSYEEKEAYYAGPPLTAAGGTAALTEFVGKATRPLVMEFTQRMASRVLASPIRSHFLFLSKKMDKQHRNRMRMMKAVAQEFRDQLLFFHVDYVGDNAPVINLLAVSEEQLPTFCIYNLEESARYRYKIGGEVTGSSMNRFVADYLAGQLNRAVVSEPLPEDWNKLPVKTLVTANFKSAVFHPDKDVFIVFYAPWSDECRTFSKVWDELGEKFADSKDKIIAKMNAVDNEVLSIKINTFPSLWWINKNTTTPLEYFGKTDLETLVNWVTSAEEPKEVIPEDEEEKKEADGVSETKREAAARPEGVEKKGAKSEEAGPSIILARKEEL